MSNIVQFKPKSTQTAEQNLAAFIALCRDSLTVFGEDLEWEAHKWAGIVTFSKLGVTTRKPGSDQVMDGNFLDFARAYFRYQQGQKPTGTKNEGKALRAVEAALLQVNGNASISGLSATVLDEAARLSKEHYSAGAAYHVGRELERLGEFVTDNKLIPNSVQGWRSPIKRQNDKNKTGKAAKRDREEKLPDEIALNALAEVFANDPEDDRDVFTTSVFAMLMSAPSRISEVLALPVDCEVREKDRNGVERYGWRFFSGKGFEGDIKWIPTEMQEVAQIAVSRARNLSYSARSLAAWIEEYPKQFYRHSNCPDVGDDVGLTMVQACQALGLSSETRKQCRTSLTNRGLEAEDGVHTLDSLWGHVLKRLPKEFPWFDKEKGIKYQNALFALNKNQFHGSKGCLPVELWKPTSTYFNHDLSPRESLGTGAHQSIFDRYGFKASDGSRLKLNSHQARHLLNTIAQRGGLSNLEIAKWSGRADVKQNRTYNHMSEYELVGMAERIDASKTLFGPTGEIPENAPVTTQEFNTLEHGAAHVTEYGFCVHDYTMSPCEKYRDCLNCVEHVCIKGDSAKLERIKNQLEKSERLFELAQSAIENGDCGADRWYEYHEKTVKRLHDLVGILDSPDVEDASQVKLRGNDFTQLRRVAEKKAMISDEGSSESNRESRILEDLTTMLGGGFGETSE